MRKALALLAVFVVVASASAWLYLTPQLALSNMRDAAAKKNAGELATYVDFPSVRTSLKAAIGDKVAALTKDQTNPLLALGAALGAALAGSFVDPVIENLVTPDGMALMLSGVPPTLLATNGDTSQAAGANVETEMRYGGLNTYIATVRRQGLPWPPVELELHREGLASWKLAAVRLP